MHTILYVEDEQWLMGGVILSLQEDYNVITARNADQALALVERQSQRIDLIVLDIMMPVGKDIIDPNHGRTSGVQLAHKLLIEDKLDVKIICYTVVTDPGIHAELMNYGVREIVSKTRTAEFLKEAIERILN